MSPTYFEVLGVDRRYHLDAADLERRYHAESKRLHPDRHAQAEAQARVKSALHTAELNQAYRALKDPVTRAEYLLKVEGLDITDEKSAQKVVSPEFLMEIMEEREKLMDARFSGDRATVEAQGTLARTKIAEAMAVVDAAFSRFEDGQREGLEGAAQALIARRYFLRMLDEAEQFLDPDNQPEKPAP